MTQDFFFHHAKWVGASSRSNTTFSVLRKSFQLGKIKKASLNIIGLGFFKCYINGNCINPDTFLPLSSDFEATCDPVDEALSGHRMYVSQFDVTSFMTEGKNSIAVHYGGGWYTHEWRVFGMPKAIFCLTAESDSGEEYFVSDETCRIGKSYISGYNFAAFEHQDFSASDACLMADYDDSDWEYACLAEIPETEYCVTDCPRDKCVRILPVKKVKEDSSGTVYDCSQNTAGYPVLKINAAPGEKVCVEFSEELSPDKELDPNHVHTQKFTVVSDGNVRIAQPEFTWFGFRYFKVKGSAVPECVKVVHADIDPSASFECNNETLNWIYKTFVHTMLSNMHTGHPSDCPHLERRGYTGDGQLTCHAVLSIFRARAFYEKWLQDIADSQDLLSGHIQYTAPYIRSGGGPGGWGCAIVEVPYQLYRHYGDKNVLRKYYGNMRRYIDYLEAHSEYGLVTSDKQGEWCLGDWCGPNILYPDKDITSSDQQVFLPAPMVNTYFMVKSLKQMCEIARILGKEEDIPGYEAKISERKGAIQAAYFNTFDGNFVMNIQGANAFAVDLGLGSEKTYENMVQYYKKLGYFDTGIFATDIVTRVLFERGDASLAVGLLTNDGEQGYEHWRKNGATTFHEYWDSNRSRSHNHPMFGAATAYFFEYLLGIKQTKDSAGYASVIIAPEAVSCFTKMSGSMTVPAGTIAVSYENTASRVSFSISIPKNTSAKFLYKDKEIVLSEGKNEFELAE